METTTSADGTVIAYDRAGHGPPLVVVAGALCDRRSFVPPAELTSRFTVYTYDRRGRGDSGDTGPYSPGREIEDLAAVAEVARSGAGGEGRVFVFGHSSGAALALQAAAGGVPFTAIAAYEAPYLTPAARDLIADPAPQIIALVAAGRRSDAVRFWMTEVVRAPAEVVAMMARFPMWPGLEALAHTLPYDLAVVAADQGIPADDLARITVPVLILGGGNSPDWFRQTVEATAAVTPGARLVMVDGQDHGAPPEVITPVLTEFFLGSGATGSGATGSGATGSGEISFSQVRFSEKGEA
jgi:pimeloyl-ACP methyl ester carboxylesterase